MTATEREVDRDRAGQGLPEKLNLGCGSDIRQTFWNVDYNPYDGVDEVLDLTETPWPWPSNHFERILWSHALEHIEDLEAALEECYRVLEPGGQAVILWPVGMNELADPDHEHRWIWDTPLYYCGERPWDADVGLEVVDRDVDLHTHLNGTAGWCYRWAIRFYERHHGQGRWMFDLPVTSGEFRVVMQK